MISYDLLNELIKAGLFPHGVSKEQAQLECSHGFDLLPSLLEAWQAHLLATTSGKKTNLFEKQRNIQAIAELGRRSESGAKLTLGVPGPTSSACEHWLGTRLIWWPHGVPGCDRTSIVSSRLGRRLDERPIWFATFRAACAHALANQRVLVSSSSTTTGQFVERAAQLFSVPSLIFHVTDQPDLAVWWRKTLSRPVNMRPCLYEACVSPEIGAGPNRGVLEIADTPARDRMVIAAGDRVLVTHLRRQGNLQRLISARLSGSFWRPGSTMIATSQQLIPKTILSELARQSAVAWHVPELASKKPACDGPLIPNSATGTIVPEFQELADVDGERFLVHCTRRQHRDWPNEPVYSYIDSLILGRKESEHSAFAALTRIIRSKRLVASSLAIRGGARVVSMTAVPPGFIRQMRRFQPHRARWDFEPYGICIQTDWLVERGTRSVFYGDEDLWNDLDSSNQPFFQLRGTRNRVGNPNGKWESEKEWRHVDDIDLNSLPADKAMVFVPTQIEARKLYRVSRWPVVVCTEKDYQANRLLRR